MIIIVGSTVVTRYLFSQEVCFYWIIRHLTFLSMKSGILIQLINYYLQNASAERRTNYFALHYLKPYNEVPIVTLFPKMFHFQQMITTLAMICQAQSMRSLCQVHFQRQYCCLLLIRRYDTSCKSTYSWRWHGQKSVFPRCHLRR